jgi:outer membrane protein
MKKLSLMITAGLFFLLTIIAMPCAAADVAKIGVVDFQKFFSSSDIGKQANAKLEKEYKTMEAGLKDLGGQIEELKKSLERDAMVMNDEMIEEKQREFNIKKMDLDRMQKKYYRDLKELEQVLVQNLREKFFALVESLGKKEGYLLILEKTAAIYYPSAIDITDKLIEMANTQALSLEQ